jgi:heme exporter protein D
MKLDYVGGAYLVFALIMAWDFIAPRIKLAQVRRMITLRFRRETARKQP